MNRFIFLSLILSFIFISGRICDVRAGDPHSAYYSRENDRLFWFIQITDLQIGAQGNQDSDNLTWIVTEARDIINPEFIVATGDLTDSTNGRGDLDGLSDGPYPEEWAEYTGILSQAGIQDADYYYDIPGNHDHYNDKNFTFYLNNSIQGQTTGNTQVSWRRDFPFGSYHFIGICTAGNDGAPFNLFDASYGDHAGLDKEELDFIESRLANNRDVDVTVIFGHHPLPMRRTNDPTDTYLTYGIVEFIQLMETYGVSMYANGHTHDTGKGLIATDNSDGIFDLNVSPLGKDPGDYYQLIAIDCNGISTERQTVGVWPVVLITAPMDMKLDADYNPYAYSINEMNPKPIRALVFDRIPVTRVQFRIDSGAWQSMAVSPTNPNLWEAFWDEPALLDGEHILEVQAEGSSNRVMQITIGDRMAFSSLGSKEDDGDSCFVDSLSYSG